MLDGAPAHGGRVLLVAHQEIQIHTVLPAVVEQQQGRKRLLEEVVYPAQPPFDRLRSRAEHRRHLAGVHLLPDAQVQQLVFVGLEVARALPGQLGQIGQIGGRHLGRQERRVGSGEGLLHFLRLTWTAAHPLRQVAMGEAKDLALERRFGLAAEQRVVDTIEARLRRRRGRLPIACQAKGEVIDARKVAPVQLDEGGFIASAGLPRQLFVAALLGVHGSSTLRIRP